MTAKSSYVRTLGRLLREAMAIFSGVAMALAGQAWFESRADRRHEQELLGVVLQDWTNQTVRTFIIQKAFIDESALAADALPEYMAQLRVELQE